MSLHPASWMMSSVHTTMNAFGEKAKQFRDHVHTEIARLFHIRQEGPLGDLFLQRVKSDKKRQHELIYDFEQGDDVLEKIAFTKKEFFYQHMNSVNIDAGDLEGNTPDSSIFSMLHALREYQRQNPKDESLAPLIGQLEEAYDFALEDKVIVEARLIGYDVTAEEEQLKKKVNSKIQQLEPGQKYLLPGGRIGHALLYEISCRLDQEGKKVFDFKIYNGGEGVERHYSKSMFSLLNPWARYQTYIIEGISADALLQSQFVDQLIDTRSKGLWLIKYYVPIVSDFIDLFVGTYSIHSIYNLAKKHLINRGGGKCVRTEDPKFTHKTHNYGTCTWKVLTYWTHENMKEYDYRNFKLSMLISSRRRLQEALEAEQKQEEKVVLSRQEVMLAKSQSMGKKILNKILRRHSAEAMPELAEKVYAKRLKKAIMSSIDIDL